jgi:hypothetical protein
MTQRLWLVRRGVPYSLAVALSEYEIGQLIAMLSINGNQ